MGVTVELDHAREARRQDPPRLPHCGGPVGHEGVHPEPAGGLQLVDNADHQLGCGLRRQPLSGDLAGLVSKDLPARHMGISTLLVVIIMHVAEDR